MLPVQTQNAAGGSAEHGSSSRFRNLPCQQEEGGSNPGYQKNTSKHRKPGYRTVKGAHQPLETVTTVIYLYYSCLYLCFYFTQRGKNIKCVKYMKNNEEKKRIFDTRLIQSWPGR